jgi:hypothetical protein
MGPLGTLMPPGTDVFRELAVPRLDATLADPVAVELLRVDEKRVLPGPLLVARICAVDIVWGPG